MFLHDFHPILYIKMVDLGKILHLYLNHFPKYEKYCLCSSIRSNYYEIYDILIEVAKRYHKKTSLTNLDISHEQLRMKLLLAKELGYFTFKNGIKTRSKKIEARRYLYISGLIDEIGRIIGSLLKSHL